ncbi:MAG: TIGR02147 family protein [Bdellovibrionales bacterium]
MEVSVKSKKLKSSEALSFRRLLQEELVSRCRSNPNYSLRAFARSLNIEPSALSQILSSKRPLTEKMKLRLGSVLGLSVHELNKIPNNEITKGSIVPFQHQTLDAFSVISDWYHYAILELTYLKSFEPNAQWVSRRLGITKTEAKIAVERLMRLDLLQEMPDGTWKDISENGNLSHLTNDMTSSAARKYQCQLLEISKKAVQEVPLLQRNHTSATFAFKSQDMERAKKRITEFRRSFAQEFYNKEESDEVYQIQISFFPLTNTSKKEPL